MAECRRAREPAKEREQEMAFIQQATFIIGINLLLWVELL
jgi:hypothetical protein